MSFTFSGMSRYKTTQIIFSAVQPLSVIGVLILFEDPKTVLVILISLILLFLPLNIFIYNKVNEEKRDTRKETRFQFLALFIFLVVTVYGLFIM